MFAYRYIHFASKTPGTILCGSSEVYAGCISSLRTYVYYRCFTAGFSAEEGPKKTSESGGLMKTVQKVRDRLGDPKEEDLHSEWDSLWKDGMTPWDLGKPTPVLIKELELERERVLRTQMENVGCRSTLRTLVPGCGAGHDIITLSRHHDFLISKSVSAVDSVVVGLDVSPTSLERAAEVIKGSTIGSMTRVELMSGDFFADTSRWTAVNLVPSDYPTNSNDELEKRVQVPYFDLIVDYTFFCALPPSLRPDWGKRISELLCPRRGKLLTLVFPILPEDEDEMKGPPYPVNVQNYSDVLEPHGVILASKPYESPYTVPSRVGKEMVCWWKIE